MSNSEEVQREIERVKQLLSRKPGYLKKGDHKVSKRFDCSKWVAKHAKKQAKEDLRKETSENTDNKSKSSQNENGYFDPESNYDPYEERLEYLGIEKEDVASVKFWQNMAGDDRFSIVMKNDDEINYELFLDRDFGNYNSPEFIPEHFERKSLQDNIGVVNLYDAHIDKLPFASEYGLGDNTIEENEEEFEDAFDELLFEAYDRHGIQELIFPIGHDFWNSNVFDQETANGTPQDLLVPKQRSFEIGFKLLRRCIEKAAQVVPKVYVPVVAGNHDKHDCFYLGQLMKVAFENVDRVDISGSIEPRKYYRYKKVLLGFTHGRYLTSKSKIEKAPLRMSEEAPYKWADTHGGMRELLCGHFHNEQTYSFLRTKDSIGVQVRFLRGVGQEGEYEMSAGYVGVPKTAELSVYRGDGLRKKSEEVVWW